VLSHLSYTLQVSKECYWFNRYNGYKKYKSEFNSRDKQQESVSPDDPWHIGEMLDRTSSQQGQLEQQNHTYFGSDEHNGHPYR